MTAPIPGQAIDAFCKWLVESRRLPANPLGPGAKQNASSTAEIFGEPAHLKADYQPLVIKAFDFTL